MLSHIVHRLLRRQIRNSGFDKEDIEKFGVFLNLVDDAYKSFDSDINHIELILEQSSNELFKANRLLESKVVNAESNLNNIVNTIDGVIFKTDIEGNFKYLNNATLDLLGVPSEEALGKNYRDFLIGINAKEKERLNKYLKKKKRDVSKIFKYIKPDGERVWIQLLLTFTYDKKGNQIGTIGTMTDVTQLKETERELDNANKVKDEFLSTMSHEIRTPLNAVIGMSEILLMENYLPEQLENLKVLKYSSEHLLALVNDLLDLNRFKSDEIRLVNEDFDLKELIENIQLHFKLTASSKNLSFNTEVDEGIPQMLKGDSVKLSQVLKNLLSNAFKFTHKGGVLFTVKIIKSYSTNTKIRFRVKDSGIGVSFDKQKNIFKSFAQATSDTSRLYGGSGLGLYISKELLNIYNSKLELESSTGNGSTFWFDINFNHAVIQTPNLASKAAKTSSINLKVLIAEDNKVNAMLLKKLLTKWGLDFVFADNGQNALDILKNQNFDLVLMDLQMPVLDGYETINAIRKLKDAQKSQIPIIALTAFSHSEIIHRLERYNINGYISKPFNVNELHDTLMLYTKQDIY